IVGAVIRRRRVDRTIGAVVFGVVLVQPGVHENGVAGTDARSRRRRRVAAATMRLVGAHHTFERRLDLRTLVRRWIDVVDAAAHIGLRFRTRAHGDGLGDRLRTPADDAVRIGEDETRLVRCIGFQIENAPRNNVRRDDVPGALLIDPLAVQTQHGQARLPLRLAGLSIRHPDLCVAVGVAVDRPLEAEVDQGRVVDDELAWLDANLRRGGAWTVAGTHAPRGAADGAR